MLDHFVYPVASADSAVEIQREWNFNTNLR